MQEFCSRKEEAGTEKCWGLGRAWRGTRPAEFGITRGQEAGFGRKGEVARAQCPARGSEPVLEGRATWGGLCFCQVWLGRAALLFQGANYIFYSFSVQKRSCSEAIMGMFLSNVVFPLQASGTVTFLYILVTISRTACCLHTGEPCLGPPNFAHPGGSGAFSPSPGLTLYRCSQARGAGLQQGRRAGWGPPAGPRRSPRGVLAPAGCVPSTQHFWGGLAAAGTSSSAGQWSWGGEKGRAARVGFCGARRLFFVGVERLQSLWVW